MGPRENGRPALSESINANKRAIVAFSRACGRYAVVTNAPSQGRNAIAIWQDLVDGSGFTARAIIETAAGEEAQVDYGDGPMVPATA